MIDSFRDKNYFLSNYYHCKIIYNNIEYKNTEAAFHAQKDLSQSYKFKNLNPAEAKSLGRRVKLRSDWEDVKDNIMYEINKAKFIQNPDLKRKLLDTGDQILIEGNTWKDTYWGVYNSNGLNKLGKILMRIRKEFRENKC